MFCSPPPFSICLFLFLLSFVPFSLCLPVLAWTFGFYCRSNITIMVIVTITPGLRWGQACPAHICHLIYICSTLALMLAQKNSQRSSGKTQCRLCIMLSNNLFIEDDRGHLLISGHCLETLQRMGFFGSPSYKDDILPFFLYSLHCLWQCQKPWTSLW
jgi:hypothetical protein